MTRLFYLFTLPLLLISSSLFAQNPDQSRLLILSEGAVEGRFASINPESGDVEVFDTLPDPSFTNASFDDILVHEDRVFVSGGDANLLVYDTRTMTLVDSLTGFVPRKLALYDGLLLMTTYDAPFFRAYDIEDLTLAWSLDTSIVPHEADDLHIKGDTAFVAISGLNGFGDYGQVGNTVVVIDLPMQDTIATITVGSNPTQLIPSGDNLYVKSLFGDFPDAFIDLVGIDMQSLNSVSRDSLFDSDFYGPMASDGALLYYQDTMPAFTAFDPLSGTTSTGIEGSFYAATYDESLSAFLLSQGGFGADTSRVFIWAPVGIGFGVPDTFIVETSGGGFNSVRSMLYVSAPEFGIDELSGAEQTLGQYCADSVLTLNLNGPEWLTGVELVLTGSGSTDNFIIDNEFDLPTDLTLGGYTITSSWSYLGMAVEEILSFDLVDCSSSRFDDFATSFAAYPNPTTGLLTLQFDHTLRISIEVLNLQGQRLLQQNVESDEMQLDLRDYSSGVYLLHVTNGSQQLIRRIVKR